ncbi:MAG: hypothetical protein ACPGVT_07975 [Maricaulaceae bacterium]
MRINSHDIAILLIVFFLLSCTPTVEPEREITSVLPVIDMSSAIDLNNHSIHTFKTSVDANPVNIEKLFIPTTQGHFHINVHLRYLQPDKLPKHLAATRDGNISTYINKTTKNIYGRFDVLNEGGEILASERIPFSDTAGSELENIVLRERYIQNNQALILRVVDLHTTMEDAEYGIEMTFSVYRKKRRMNW